MKKIAHKLGYLGAGLIVGIASTMLIGAAEPEPKPADRYDVSLQFALIAALVVVHDREQNSMLIYELKDDSTKAELLRTVDLKNVGGQHLDVAFPE